eukprot:scaffold103102_cov63-Phaeocystis_antarctica.AAC.1
MKVASIRRPPAHSSALYCILALFGLSWQLADFVFLLGLDLDRLHIPSCNQSRGVVSAASLPSCRKLLWGTSLAGSNNHDRSGLRPHGMDSDVHGHGPAHAAGPRLLLCWAAAPPVGCHHDHAEFRRHGTHLCAVVPVCVLALLR